MRKMLAPVLILLFLLSGCATLTRQLIEKPTVTFDHLTVQDVTLTGQTLVFCFKVQNPNRWALTLENLDYGLQVAGHDLGFGRLSKPLVIAGGGSGMLELTLRLDHLKLLDGALDLFKAGKLDYRLNGNLRMGLVSMPLTKTGQLDMPKLPTIKLAPSDKANALKALMTIFS